MFRRLRVTSVTGVVGGMPQPGCGHVTVGVVRRTWALWIRPVGAERGPARHYRQVPPHHEGPDWRRPTQFRSAPTLPRMAAPRQLTGVLGGTFDPPHIGHLLAAINVRHALDLDEVLLVVA